MYLSDLQIKKACLGQSPMISPFVDRKMRIGALSYGNGHFGYDLRIIGTAKTIKPGQRVDPCADKDELSRLRYDEHPLDGFVLKPHGFVLAASFEYFHIPNNVLAVAADKSTLARIGIAVQNTVMEPSWQGYLTLEISNHGPVEVVLRDGMPIAQMLFAASNEVPEQLYNGRYQNQKRGVPALSFGMPADIQPEEMLYVGRTNALTDGGRDLVRLPDEVQ